MRTTDLARPVSWSVITLTVVVGLAIGFALAGEGTAMGVGITTSSGSRIWLEGNSTLHPYRAEAKQWQVAFDVPSATKSDPSALVRNRQVAGMTVTIAVGGLRSGEGGLDDNMAKALDGKAHPQIVYRMTSYTVQPADNNGTFPIDIQGILNVAGREKAVALHAQATLTADGLHLVGSTPLLMSDFGVKAPVFMLGMIKTDDKVVIRFDLQLQAQP